MVGRATSIAKRKVSGVKQMIVILGQCPSLKNNKQLFINRRTGKHFITSSKTAKDWTAQALAQLEYVEPIQDYPIRLSATFYCKDNRRRDLDNMLSTCLDALRHGGVLEDDNWQLIPEVVIRGALDKKHPRVEITIKQIEE